MKKVVIYSTPWCPYCIRAKMLLEKKGVEFTDINVSGDPAKRAEMEKLSKRRTVPQIWIGTQHIGGCDELMQLERKGQLDALLAAGE